MITEEEITVLLFFWVHAMSEAERKGRNVRRECETEARVDASRFGSPLYKMETSDGKGRKGWAYEIDNWTFLGGTFRLCSLSLLCVMYCVNDDDEVITYLGPHGARRRGVSNVMAEPGTGVPGDFDEFIRRLVGIKTIMGGQCAIANSYSDFGATIVYVVNGAFWWCTGLP